MKLATGTWVVLALLALLAVALIAVLLWCLLRRRNGSEAMRVDEQRARTDLASAGWAAPHATPTPPSPYAAPSPYAVPSPELPHAAADPSRWSGAGAAAAMGAGVAGSVFARPEAVEPASEPGQELAAESAASAAAMETQEEVISGVDPVHEILTLESDSASQGEESSDALDDVWSPSAPDGTAEDVAATAAEGSEGVPLEQTGELEVLEAAPGGQAADGAEAGGDSVPSEPVEEDLWMPSEGPVRPSPADAAAAAARARIEGDGGAPDSTPGVAQPDVALAQSGELSSVPEPEPAVETDTEPEPETEAVLEGDEAALAGSPDTDAAEAAYGEAEAEAAELSATVTPLGAPGADPVFNAADDVSAGSAAESGDDAAAVREADEAALAGSPHADDAEARFQAALDSMTAERDALAAGGPIQDWSEAPQQPVDAIAPDSGADRSSVAGTDPGGASAAEADLDAPTEHPTSAPESAATAAASARRRWVSEYDEVVDGGYGWGSAAPVWDGAMPLGHPVKANRQWMKFQEPADGWYEQMQADVWFVDADTARRFGFTKD